jgi:hypothetical protein
MIFIDHDAMPTITGTGSEDYFNNAWCFHHAFTFPWYGAPLLSPRVDGGAFTNLYRFHGPDPVRFQTHIRVTIERWWETYKTNNFASVAFWYQQEPMATRVPLPLGKENHPIFHKLLPDEYRNPAASGVDIVALEVPLRATGVEVSVLAALGHEFLGEGAILVRCEGKTLKLPLLVPEDGLYRVELKPVYSLLEGGTNYRVGEENPVSIVRQQFRRENDGPRVTLGTVRSQDRVIELEISGPGSVPVHEVVCKRID